jgi:hypothetical protein
MITVYGTLFLIVICTIIPSVLDRYVFKRFHSMYIGFAAYGIMSVLLIIVPLFGSNIFASGAIAIASVIISAYIANISLVSTAFVLFLSTIILPITVVFDIAETNKVKNPISMIFHNTKWYGLLIPFCLGVITLTVVRRRIKASKES